MTGRIPQNFIDDVLARTDIVELVRARVQLSKRGVNYLARCPFHEEKTPSFSVNQDKQFYYCFGCGAHGNAIGFLMAFDRMEFLDALNHLATHLGMEVPQTSTQKSRTHESQELYPLMEKASHYYQQQLRNAPLAIDYLKSRGLDGHTAKRFMIGFAPPQWENLLSNLGRDTKTKAHLLTNGLLIKKNERTYDRFRNRIIFPIRDVRGRVIAFGGRTIGDDFPKYMNSPETPIFHKSSELYGLYEARQQNNELARILIVEGYMDVVSLNQHGITYAVATLGTATNPRHLQKLLRYTHEVIFCFDGDIAGRKAAWKALTISLPIMRDGIHIRFLFLPQGEDPDSLIQKIGHNKFNQLLNSAEPLSDVFFNQLQSKIKLDSLDGKAHFAKEASTYLNTMPEGLFRQLLFERLGKLLHIEVNELTDFLSEAKTPVPSAPQPLVDDDKILPPACLAIAFLLQRPQLAQDIENIDDLKDAQSPGIPLLIKLIKILQAQPELTTGHLLSICENSEDQDWIAQLAARKLPIPDSGLALELKGALSRLREQQQDHLAQQLIKKAQNTALTSDEKKILHELLTNLQSDPIL